MSVTPESLDFAKSPGTSSAAILALPLEILDQIWNSLSPIELAQVSQTCQRFKVLASSESRWKSYVQENVASSIQTAKPYSSFNSLYKAHSPFWFLPRHKLWFSDAYPHGKLMIARYDYRSGCIEGYALAARPHRARSTKVLAWEHGVVYQTFQPVVQLDLNQPVIRLGPEQSATAGNVQATLDGHGTFSSGIKFQAETRMEIPSSLRSYSGHITRTLLRAQDLPTNLCDSRTALWPPLRIPSPGNRRTRASSTNLFSSRGHMPASQSKAADTTFRVRKTLDFHPFTPLQSMFSTVSTTLDGLAGDHVETYGTLDPCAYTPTSDKPWQGIFAGDYSSHGCEFLLITQPDSHDARPLPQKACRALERWPNSTQWQALLVDVPAEDDDILDDDADVRDEMTEPSFRTTLSAAVQLQLYQMSNRQDTEGTMTQGDPNDTIGSSQNRGDVEYNNIVAGNRDQSPFKGRLEAIKLTGDPNVPRGEITFVADDLGDRGLVGYTKERDFVESKAASEGRTETPAKSNVYDPGTTSTFVTPHSEGAAPSFIAELDGGDPPPQPEIDPDFRGTRMVRSVGHICENARARRESYIPSQLMLISPDRIAQYWMPYQHVSFYTRVNWEKFLDVEP